MKPSLIQRVLNPQMLLHLALWITAILLTVTLFGKLWPSRAGSIVTVLLGLASIGFIVLYWVKGTPGLYGLLAVYGLLDFAAIVMAIEHLEASTTGLHWLFAALILTLPIFEIYTLIAAERDKVTEKD